VYNLFMVFCTVIILYALHILYAYDLIHRLLSFWKIYDSVEFVCMRSCRHVGMCVRVCKKSLVTGLSSTLRPHGSMTSGSIVFLPLASSSRIHLQRRHASCRCARPLPAKAATIPYPQFCHQAAISGKTDGIFDMPQSWDMGHIILLPFRRKAY
jgi:ferredoxin